MNISEISNFVEDKRKFIKEIFDKNQEELSTEIDIESIDDAYRVMLQLTNKNLDIIESLKNEHENSCEEQEKVQLKDMITKLVKSVTDTLSAYTNYRNGFRV